MNYIQKINRDNQGKFCKGNIPWNKELKGIHLSPKTEFKKGEVSNENHPRWEGKNASYSAIHMWLYRHFGNICQCEECGTKNAKKFEWANISGKYKRDKKDWRRLCTSCHQQFDGHRQKQWATRRSNICV